jgi:TRAP-type C4-dicarboxylate transport system substrate-binding protein
MLDSLPAEIRTIMEEKAYSCITEYGDALCLEMADGFRQQLINGGMEEINVDTAPFRDKVSAVYDRYFAEVWTASTLEEVLSFAN